MDYGIATQTAKNKKWRHDAVKEIIIPHLNWVDRKRAFTDTEKRLVWTLAKLKNKGKTPICKLCRRPVRSYKQLSGAGYQPDHRLPVKLGGPSKIKNAQVSHERCNKSKGARVRRSKVKSRRRTKVKSRRRSRR